MYHNILVPIAYDNDHDSSLSIEVAKRLAADGANVTFLHVMEEVPAYVASYLPEGFRETASHTIEGDLKEKAKGFKNGQAKIVVGQPGRSIVDWADSHKVDLIVIASHRPGLQDYFLGSTAARVVRHSTAAVHVLR